MHRNSFKITYTPISWKNNQCHILMRFPHEWISAISAPPEAFHISSHPHVSSRINENPSQKKKKRTSEKRSKEPSLPLHSGHINMQTTLETNQTNEKEAPYRTFWNRCNGLSGLPTIHHLQIKLRSGPPETMKMETMMSPIPSSFIIFFPLW